MMIWSDPYGDIGVSIYGINISTYAHSNLKLPMKSNSKPKTTFGKCSIKEYLEGVVQLVE